MRVRFSGVIDFDETPDDRGSVDVWVVNEIEEAIKVGPETDDIYERLKLEWKIE